MLDPSTFKDFRPTELHQQTLWDRLTWQKIEVITPERQKFLDALPFIKVELNCLKISKNTIVDYHTARNELEITPFFDKFFHAQTQHFKLPKAHPKVLSESLYVTFKHGSAFTLDGELAINLFDGGAYAPSHRLSPPEIKKLAGEFCHGLFGDRYDEVLVWTSDQAWSDWFHNVAWDHTWIILDKRTRHIWTLMLTDTD